MHDSIRLEAAGIPTVATTTHEFMHAARTQASALGRPDFDAVSVEHPIQDQTAEAIRERADRTLAEIVGRLLE